MNVFHMIKKISKLNKNTKIKIKILNSSKNEISKQKLNFDKISSELKWKQKTNLDVGLKKTFEWYKNNIKFLKIIEPAIEIVIRDLYK